MMDSISFAHVDEVPAQGETFRFVFSRELTTHTSSLVNPGEGAMIEEVEVHNIFRCRMFCRIERQAVGFMAPEY